MYKFWKSASKTLNFNMWLVSSALYDARGNGKKGMVWRLYSVNHRIKREMTLKSICNMLVFDYVVPNFEVKSFNNFRKSPSYIQPFLYMKITKVSLLKRRTIKKKKENWRLCCVTVQIWEKMLNLETRIYILDFFFTFDIILLRLCWAYINIKESLSELTISFQYTVFWYSP